MKIGCIIQARSGSSRLPNKVLLPLPNNGEKSVLEWVVERVKNSKLIEEIIIATTDNAKDDKIVALSQKMDILCYRGSENHVLSRYFEAAKANNLDIIVRITSDCPCIDWQIIDQLITNHIENDNDYTSNTLVRSFPHGLDAEVFNFEVLKEANECATLQSEYEHVTPYIYKTKAEKFKIQSVEAKAKERNPNIRVTLDTKEDYLALCALFHEYSNTVFTCQDIIETYQLLPWLSHINSNIHQKKVCSSIEEELDEIVKLGKKQDLHRMVSFLEGVKKDGLECSNYN